MTRTFIVSVILLISFSTGIAQSEWKFKKVDENGIEIFTRDKNDSPYKEYRITALLPTQPETILKELIEAPKYMEGAEPGVSYYLKEQGPDQHLFYVVKKLPWPIKDRDLITLITVKRPSDDTIILTMEGFPEGLPLVKNTIRIKNLMGQWTLKKSGDNTAVTQQLFVDPEGSLPPFVTNSMLTKGPYKTFLELLDVAKNDKSQDLGI